MIINVSIIIVIIIVIIIIIIIIISASSPKYHAIDKTTVQACTSPVPKRNAVHPQLS